MKVSRFFLRTAEAILVFILGMSAPVASGEVTCRTVQAGNDSGFVAFLTCSNSDEYQDSLLLVRPTDNSTNAITHPECVFYSTCTEPFVVPKGGIETTVLRISQVDNYLNSPPWSITFVWKDMLGATFSGYNSSIVYTPPWAGDVPYRVSQGHFGSFTHRELKAIDYVLPRNTPVVASREGVVIRVVDGYPDGMDCMVDGVPDFGMFPANRVVVLHRDGTTASYVHMEANTIPVIRGTVVSRGTLLGRSGSSGCSNAPHLHWQVDGFTGGFTVPEDDRRGGRRLLLGSSWSPGFPNQGTIDTDTAWDCVESTRGEPKEGWYVTGIPESAVLEPLIIPEEWKRVWTMPPEMPYMFYAPRPGACLPLLNTCDQCTLRGEGAEAVEGIFSAGGDPAEAAGVTYCELHASGRHGNVTAVCCAYKALDDVRSIVVTVEVKVNLERSSDMARITDPRIAGHSALEASAALSEGGEILSFDVLVAPGASAVMATFGKADQRGIYELAVPGISFDNSIAAAADDESELGQHRYPTCSFAPLPILRDTTGPPLPPSLPPSPPSLMSLPPPPFPSHQSPSPSPPSLPILNSPPPGPVLSHDDLPPSPPPPIPAPEDDGKRDTTLPVIIVCVVGVGVVGVLLGLLFLAFPRLRQAFYAQARVGAQPDPVGSQQKQRVASVGLQQKQRIVAWN